MPQRSPYAEPNREGQAIKIDTAIIVSVLPAIRRLVTLIPSMTNILITENVVADCDCLLILSNVLVGAQ